MNNIKDGIHVLLVTVRKRSVLDDVKVPLGVTK